MVWIQQSKIKVICLIIILCLFINIIYKVILYTFSTEIFYPPEDANLPSLVSAVVVGTTTNEPTTTAPKIMQPELPLMLDYTTFWGTSMFSTIAIDALKKCPFKCRWSNDKRYVTVVAPSWCRQNQAGQRPGFCLLDLVRHYQQV